MTDHPSILEIEQGVLGAAMLDRSRAYVVAALSEEHFRYEPHRAALKSIQSLCERSEHVDDATVLLAAADATALTPDAVSGMLTRGAPLDSKAFESYIQNLHRERARQSLAAHGRKAASKAVSRDVDPRDLALELFDDLLKIDAGAKIGPRLLSEVVADKDNFAIVLPNEGKAPIAYPSGYHDLDRMLAGGFRPGEMVVIAARPSMGKTALAACIGLNYARRGQGVLAFSLEQRAVTWIQRLICVDSGAPYGAFRSGRLEASDRLAASRSLGALTKMPFWIDDRSAISVHEIFAEAKRLAAQHPIYLVIVDYLQLVTAKVGRDTTREREVAMISKTLKHLAKEIGCPVIAVAQLNRESAKRKGKDRVPGLPDLRESGSIEQDADIVLFPFRPGYYERDKVELENVAYIHVGKQRDGETGRVEVLWEGEHVRFLNIDKHHADDVI